MSKGAAAEGGIPLPLEDKVKLDDPMHSADYTNGLQLRWKDLGANEGMHHY